MGESLKRFHVPTSGSAEAAKKPKRSSERKETYSSTDSIALQIQLLNQERIRTVKHC